MVLRPETISSTNPFSSPSVRERLRNSGLVLPVTYLVNRIDIGTVTVRLLVARVSDAGLEPLAKGYAICNLGQDVDATGVLREDAMQRVADAVSGFLAQRDALPGGKDIPTVCVATSASRDAANGGVFRAKIEALGVRLAIVPGEREAALSFAGASLDFPGRPVVVVDVGGGSTEIIAGMGGADPVLAHSFNIGCRRVTERFLHTNPPTPEELTAAAVWMSGEMEPYLTQVREAGFGGAKVVAVAGTATSVVSIHKEMAVYDSAQVHGFPVSQEILQAVLDRLTALPLEDRRCVVGLDPRRADVIVGGLLVLVCVLRLLGAHGFTASENDLLQGGVLALSRGELR